jgi:preprotein translocase subunit SecE
MNSKVEQQPVSNIGDIVKLALAVLLVVAGILGYYQFDQINSAVRAVAMIGVVGLSIAIAAFTAHGRAAREFFTEANFELRKVVWPTRQETIQTTIAVMFVVLILSLILWVIDITLGWVILDHLLRSKG